MNLQTGDLLFCSYENGELSSAIDVVTQTDKQTHYSHMGIVEISNQDTFVIHASLKRGVVKEPIKSFFIKDNPVVTDVYRLKEDYQSTIPEAINKVQLLVGLPYNSHYLMNDSCYYCSQLIYKIFELDKVFILEPMTFMDPNSDQFNMGWIKHYENLNMDIPEGQLGCNPNGLATSEKLQFIVRIE